MKSFCFNFAHSCLQTYKKTEAKKKKQISWEKTNQFVSIPTITRNISNNVFYQFFLLRKRMQCTNFQSILSHKLNQLTLSMHRITEHSQSCLEKYVFYSPITCNVCMLQIYCVFGECSEHVRGFVIYFFCIYILKIVKMSYCLSCFYFNQRKFCVRNFCKVQRDYLIFSEKKRKICDANF